MPNPVKTIQYNPEYLRQEWKKLSNNFCQGCHTETIAQFLGKDLINQIISQVNQIQKNLERECSIIFIGDFKRGKSTLINALLQFPVVTTDVTPETITINEIRYGDSLKIKVCFHDGRYISLEPEELKAEQLLSIIAQYGSIPSRLDSADCISHVQIETPVKWLEGIRLVDTPGTGDIFHQFDHQVQTYLQKADVVVWVMSALAPLSESEQAFIKLAVLPHDFPKLIFAINWMDVAHNNIEAERLLNSTYSKIYSNFPNSHIFPVSALDEFCRTQSLPRPNLSLAPKLESYFDDFQNYIRQSVILNRDIIQLERACNQMYQVLDKFDFNINLVSRLVEFPAISDNHPEHISELREKTDQLKQQIQMEITQLNQQAHLWMIEFIARIQRETITTLHQLSLDEIRCHFSFFLTEKLRQAIHECINVHQIIILEKLKQLKASLLEDLYNLNKTQITGANLAIPSAALDDMQWSDIDAIQLLINLSPLGNILRVLTAFVGQDKSKKIKLLTTYQQRFQEYIPELQSCICQHLDKIYAQISTSIDEQIEKIYKQEIETSLAAIKQAQTINSQSQKPDIKNEASTLVNDTRYQLKLFREKLNLAI